MILLINNIGYKMYIPFIFETSVKPDNNTLVNKTIIKVVDFNNIANNYAIINKLRKLTLHNRSGMNYELDNLLNLSKIKEVNCKVILSHINDELVGWALLSLEPSNVIYSVMDYDKSYNSGYGALFQIFIHPDHRKKGIGSEIIKVAKRKVNNKNMCICPWDSKSYSFFAKFNNFSLKEMRFRSPKAKY